MARIESIQSLRAIYGEPMGRSVAKQLDHIDKHCRRFIELSPFLIIATQGVDGYGDATPRGDHPGFVTVSNDTTLIIPDRPGNRRLDSLSNIVERPGIGLIFLIPGVDETLRVNGTAIIDDDLALRAAHRADGKVPATVLVVTVKEAYLQCAKALMRSKLWADESRIDRAALPTMGEMLKDHTRSNEPPESQDAMVERYARQLY
ncbi:pyridoxamine 5'-phosphate oxidase family protein [Kaistia dalseonensis]|uniref:PPOX class probable FMN-dependent enzyme n=1 Tax=Kaistia dalseonensis TaxID=410840 RepID=A0ABU0HCN1_9HYPH|nr:pyridoxamine 5'-phosphate oxidase family protein [Kaistia dalseonensis]MCX5497437.1 pyridoxamine 5'-phosphate oxidase family protein [Kaistia dalseonensis]MDQ0440076.1 PPOX class probable FMN-dependent enzyme [Kaistia dalseonensis]